MSALVTAECSDRGRERMNVGPGGHAARAARAAGPLDRDGMAAVVVDLERAEQLDLHGVVTDSRTSVPGRQTLVVCFPSPKITKATWSMSIAKRSKAPSGRHPMAAYSATQ
jgi:hypothetical protein